VTYSVHLVDDVFLRSQKLYHPDLSGSTRFFIFLGGGSRISGPTFPSKCPFLLFLRAERFARAELTGYPDLLVRTDPALKTTGQDPRLLLERVLIAVCRAKAS
jgi:hypothetical protein